MNSAIEMNRTIGFERHSIDVEQAAATTKDGRCHIAEFYRICSTTTLNAAFFIGLHIESARSVDREFVCATDVDTAL